VSVTDTEPDCQDQGCEWQINSYQLLSINTSKQIQWAEYNVPYETMGRWNRQLSGGPRWLVKRDQQRRTSLPTSGGCNGGSTLLGRIAEKKIVLTVARRRTPSAR
jgi:hypothetical protein